MLFTSWMVLPAMLGISGVVRVTAFGDVVMATDASERPVGDISTAVRPVPPVKVALTA